MTLARLTSPRTPRMLAFAACLALSACAPKIMKFEVRPSHICAGTKVVLELDVKGTPTIVTTPPLQPVADKTYVPTSSTHFVLSVKRGFMKPLGSEVEVKLLPGDPPQPDELTANVACQAGKLVGTVHREAREWDQHLRVGTLESGEDREVRVEHAGRSAQLTPASPTTQAFDGTSPGGDWVLTSPLASGESCTPGGAPNILNVQAQVRCGD